jgi:hypothetical protein
VSDGGNYTILIDGVSIVTDNCGVSPGASDIRNHITASCVATTTGMVELEVYNWREGLESTIENYIDNIRVYMQNPTFEALNREVSASSGGVFNFDINPGPAYANQWYMILQGFTGNHPGFNMSAGAVHVPLNADVWTDIALGLNPFWNNFYSALDGNGHSDASMSTFGPQPIAEGLALYLDVLVLKNPSDTVVFATNPISVLFTP